MSPTMDGGTRIVDGATYFAQERLRWNEHDFQSAVVGLFHDHGYALTYHTFDSRRSAAGFPDIVAVKRGRIVYAELKSMKGVVSDAQNEWLQALTDGGGEAYLWRPCCWNSGEIEGVLR